MKFDIRIIIFFLMVKFNKHVFHIKNSNIGETRKNHDDS